MDNVSLLSRMPGSRNFDLLSSSIASSSGAWRGTVDVEVGGRRRESVYRDGSDDMVLICYGHCEMDGWALTALLLLFVARTCWL